MPIGNRYNRRSDMIVQYIIEFSLVDWYDHRDIVGVIKKMFCRNR
jgi:hypothetical protein